MASVVRSEMSPRSISANAPMSVRKNRPMVVEVSTASPLRSTMCRSIPASLSSSIVVRTSVVSLNILSNFIVTMSVYCPVANLRWRIRPFGLSHNGIPPLTPSSMMMSSLARLSFLYRTYSRIRLFCA